ncbi:TAXI family TRAP transporter solute-binding subunit [Paracoccus subflavus]|uniref:TAXI family TRAP transporter solute-binding subunit n=1 Tax=Paracoccus subflavus TaxID=2528244 RepID=A0A4Q9FV88_9RHOB|nr:TAXI family TRAP transporter solute-binding subunit [Paracoccus subflavus]TBN36365.1 TAXI family TRAP transporter solute-binding subunit [Paracoccus subflavus]
MTTLSRRRLLGTASAGLALMGSGLPLRAQIMSFDDSPITATIAGYSSRGMVSILGEAQAAVVREAFPGSNVVYEPGNPAGSFVAVVNGEREFALESTIEVLMAARGEEPFPESFEGRFWMVTMLSPDLTLAHVYGRKEFIEENGITNLTEIRDRRIPVRLGINQPGNLWARAHVHAILEAHGMTTDDIVSWGGTLIEQNTGSTMDLMRQQRADIEITGGFVPVGTMIELNSTHPLAFVPMTQEQAAAAAKIMSVNVGAIPAGSYEWQTEELHTPASSHIVIAGPAATDEQVWKLCKALDTRLDTYHSMHPALTGVTRQNIVPNIPGVPLHPAAEAYFASRTL